MMFVPHMKHTYGLPRPVMEIALFLYMLMTFVRDRKHTYGLPRPVTEISLLLYMLMTFVRDMKHTHGLPWPVTEISLLFICWCSYLTGNTPMGFHGLLRQYLHLFFLHAFSSRTNCIELVATYQPLAYCALPAKHGSSAVKPSFQLWIWRSASSEEDACSTTGEYTTGIALGQQVSVSQCCFEADWARRWGHGSHGRTVVACGLYTGHTMR
jgi:hypothetical protein